MGTSIVFVCEPPATRPGRSTPRPLALETTAGRKLAKLMSIDLVPDSFAVVPIVDQWKGRNQHGAQWPRGLAVTAAENLMVTLPKGADLLLIGERVTNAFGIVAAPFRWTALRSRKVHGATITRHVVYVPLLGSAWWKEPRNATKGARFFDVLGAMGRRT